MVCNWTAVVAVIHSHKILAEYLLTWTGNSYRENSMTHGLDNQMD